MKQEKIDELMNEIDRKCKLPKYWEKFIEDESKEHHLVIKDNKEKNLYCTNCEKYFIDKRIKVRDYIECPHCKEKSKVYGINYYRKSFEQSVVLVQRMNKKVIIRIFEIYSYFSEDNKQMKKHYIEYARIIPGIGKFLGSNVDINRFGVMIIYHGYKKLRWRKYTGYKTFVDHPTYPYNKRRLIKGTAMEYAPIEEFLKKFSYYRFNYLEALNLAAYESFELLWKMKLYNLTLNSKDLNKKGSFYNRFGVSKNFLKFMQDNNVTYRELIVLRILKREDIELIRKCCNANINYTRFLIKNNILEKFIDLGLSFYSYDIKVLKEIGNYVPLKKLMDYKVGLKYLHIYRDYLKMANKLSLNYKSKDDLYPKDLISRHDKLQEKIKVNEDMNTQFAFYLRFLELSKYTYSDDKYIIFPATSTTDLIDEGKQQGNCVGYMYLNPYIEKETEIYFIRKLSNITKSFITLEFKNGVVRQKELSHHSTNFSKEHLDFINNWCNYRELIDKKEKYQQKNKEKIKKYNLSKVAV